MASYAEKRMQKMLQSTIANITDDLDTQVNTNHTIAENLATKTFDKLMDAFVGVEAAGTFAIYKPLITNYLLDIEDSDFVKLLQQTIDLVTDLLTEAQTKIIETSGINTDTVYPDDGN